MDNDSNNKHFYRETGRFCEGLIFNSAFHRIVISQLPQKGIKSNDTRDIELARDKNDFDLEMLDMT